MPRFVRRTPISRTRIRRNDTVQVIGGEGTGRRRIAAGEDPKLRGLRGKVLRVDQDAGTATVQGIKMVFKHQRASRDPSRPGGGRIEKESPIHLSNLMLICPACDQATRVGVRLERHERAGGAVKAKRIRVCKKCGADVPERS